VELGEPQGSTPDSLGHGCVDERVQAGETAGLRHEGLFLLCRAIVPPEERVAGLQDLDRDRSRALAEIRESCRDWQHRVAEKRQRSPCARDGTGRRRNVAVGFGMEENPLH